MVFLSSRAQLGESRSNHHCETKGRSRSTGLIHHADAGELPCRMLLVLLSQDGRSTRRCAQGVTLK